MRNPGQLILVVIAVVVVGAIALITSSGGDDSSSTSTQSGGGSQAARTTCDDSAALTLNLVSSSEKEELIAKQVEAFNASGAQVGGQTVCAELRIVASGKAADQIARGKLQPDVWTPASSMWGKQVNFRADRKLVPDENPSFVRTPLVIAMWQPMAEALGYPKKRIGFADVAALAADPDGWASKGHPEWGQFRYAQASPDLSTSGLSATVFQYYGAIGAKEGIDEADVRRASPKVRRFQRSVVHYGPDTLFISEQLRKQGTQYASAVAMEEATLIDFNRKRGQQDPLVAVYPEEGSFFSDSPLIVPDAEWVTPEKREAAALLVDRLAKSITPEEAARFGFRSPDPTQELPSPPEGTTAKGPRRELLPPNPAVLTAISAAWRDDRKPANVLLVLDHSGSMDEANRIESARLGVIDFTKQFGPRDRVGLMVFNHEVERPLVPVGPGSETLPRIREAVAKLPPEGGTAIYDAISSAVSTARETASPEAINAVVLLTDGIDEDSDKSLEQALEAVAARGDSVRRVRVFTIAYSAPQQVVPVLEQLSERGEGRSYQGDTDDIVSVLREIASFL